MSQTNDPKGRLGLNLLWCSTKPSADLVFIHGLGGGSRKTWSKSSATEHFWPQEWLPRDPAFRQVRIHSFGYDADWMGGKENCLNINHISKSFIGELCLSPYLKDADTPIILIGHSMGGLVIKRAYILAQQDPLHDSLFARFHTSVFIATPHRGAGSAKYLNTLLQLTFSSRLYIADLEHTSATIQSINEDFRHVSTRINVWSLYETQKLKVGVVSTLIVDPDSATLGWREERQIPMNADHRSICKFEDAQDPNYIVIRNALSSIVHDAVSQGEISTQRAMNCSKKFYQWR